MCPPITSSNTKRNLPDPLFTLWLNKSLVQDLQQPRIGSAKQYPMITCRKPFISTSPMTASTEQGSRSQCSALRKDLVLKSRSTLRAHRLFVAGNGRQGAEWVTSNGQLPSFAAVTVDLPEMSQRRWKAFCSGSSYECRPFRIVQQTKSLGSE